MKIVVTGADGLFGRDVVAHLQYRHQTIPLSRRKLDVTDQDAVHEAILALKPDVIVHAAAFTNVDQAERERPLVFAVNAYGTGYLAEAAERIGAKFVYVSTDYVFDGKKGSPYTEEDEPNPLNVYGASKRMGEQLAADYCRRHYIVRTAWLFGACGANFASNVCRAAFAEEPVSAAVDLIGSPTFTADLARFVGQVVETDYYGLFHVVNEGHCSKYEFALEILRLLDADGSLVRPVRLEELNLAAARPVNSALMQQKAAGIGMALLEPWQAALGRFLRLTVHK